MYSVNLPCSTSWLSSSVLPARVLYVLHMKLFYVRVTHPKLWWSSWTGQVHCHPGLYVPGSPATRYTLPPACLLLFRQACPWELHSGKILFLDPFSRDSWWHLKHVPGKACSPWSPVTFHCSSCKKPASRCLSWSCLLLLSTSKKWAFHLPLWFLHPDVVLNCATVFLQDFSLEPF